MKQTLIELQEEMDKSKIIAGDFNFFFLINDMQGKSGKKS